MILFHELIVIIDQTDGKIVVCQVGREIVLYYMNCPFVIRRWHAATVVYCVFIFYKYRFHWLVITTITLYVMYTYYIS